jgi:hypothetical protein
MLREEKQTSIIEPDETTGSRKQNGVGVLHALMRRIGPMSLTQNMKSA